MKTIQIEIPLELNKRLIPYQDDLARLLEWGLRYLEEQASTKPELAAYIEQRRLMSVLREAGTIGPDASTITGYLAQPQVKNRQPIVATGPPTSQVIIEQRHGLLDNIFYLLLLHV